MMNQNPLFLRSLQQALYKDDASSLEQTTDISAGAGGGTIAGATSDFVMTSGSDSCPGCPIHYNERVLGGPGSSTTRAIHEEEEPERAILLMDLPTSLGAWTMRVKLENDGLKDEISIAKASGEFASLLTSYTENHDLVHEEAHFFTVINTSGEGKYETYLNINQMDEVVKLTYNKLNTFDVFRMSFLVLA